MEERKKYVKLKIENNMNRIFVLIFSTLLSLGVSISVDGKERVVPFNYRSEEHTSELQSQR